MATPMRVREDHLRPIAFRPTAGERALRRLAAAAGVLGLLQAALAAALAAALGGGSLPLTVGSVVAPGRGTMPVVREVAALPVPAVAAAVGVVPGVPYLLLASRPGFPVHVRELRRGRDGHHRAAGALAGPVVVGGAALGVGVTDVAALLALGGASTAAALAGGTSPGPRDPVEHVRRWSLPPPWSALAALPWLALAAHLAAGGSTPGSRGAAYGLVAAGALHVVASVANRMLSQARVGAWKSYNLGNEIAIGLGVVVSGAVAVLLTSSSIA